MIDLRKLEAFIKVYETQSFSKASKFLHLAQPTITLQIKDLEEFLGIKLFERHTRKVKPNKAGKIVYTYGKQIARLLKEMEKELELIKNEKGGIIEIGGSTIPGQYILPKVIKRFKEENPDVSVFLKVGDSKEIAEKVLRGDFDIGMIGAIFKNKELVYIPCYEDEIILIGPSGSPKTEIELKELYSISLIKREEGSGTWKRAIEILHKEGIHIEKLNIIGEMGSTEAVKEAVKAGLGYGFVSSLAIKLETQLNLIKVIRIKNVFIKRKFYFIYNKLKQMTPLEKSFIKFVKNLASLD